MQVERTAIEGLVVLVPPVFADDRGSFQETFNQKRFEQVVPGAPNFVQDNESRSAKGVLRGLHMQVGASAQAKLVRVVKGSVLDVCVDLREGSPTFGQHVAVRLDGATRRQLYVPVGFAHGFLALEDDTVFCYKCSALYHPPAERIIRWNDPDLAIDWGIDAPLVSPRDAAGAAFADREWSR